MTTEEVKNEGDQKPEEPEQQQFLQIDWESEVLKGLMYLALSSIGWGLLFCTFELCCGHRYRIWKARRAQKLYAEHIKKKQDAGTSAQDQVSITSSEGTQTEGAQGASTQASTQTQGAQGPAISTQTQTQTQGSQMTTQASVHTPPSQEARDLAAAAFRGATTAAGYAPGIPADPSATDPSIRHDRPVLQAADVVRADKRLIVKKKAAVPPKPRSTSRGRPKGKAQRLASPSPARRSLRNRKKHS